MRLRVISESGPRFKTLKDNTVKLTDEERKKVLDAGATWHMQSDDRKPSPAIKKAVVRGETYYYSNTHRAYRVASSLSQAIKDFEFVKSTS